MSVSKKIKKVIEGVALPEEQQNQLESILSKLDSKEAYETELENLQKELIHFQNWVKTNKKRVVIVFEGRDTAGKGGVIKRIMEHLNPRGCRVVALSKPSDTEKGQWYFQRYIKELPNEGEIVLFDRSWYNRAGVEKVFGFCSKKQHQLFLEQVSGFEEMLIDDGIILIKYYLSITKDTQQQRIEDRMKSLLKRWKISDIDLKGQEFFRQYTKAKEEMFDWSNTKKSPWYVVDANDKKKARLNIIKHILLVSPYLLEGGKLEDETIEFDKNLIKRYRRGS